MSQALAFLLTLVIEGSLGAALARRVDSPPLRLAGAAVVASLLTHPLAWWTSRQLSADEYAAGVIAIEGIVIGVEALLLKALVRCRARTALVLSVLFNGVSAVAGGWLLGMFE